MVCQARGTGADTGHGMTPRKAQTARAPASTGRERCGWAGQRGAGAALDRLVRDIEAVQAIRAQADDIAKRTAKLPAAQSLHATAEALVARTDTIERSMHNPDAEVVYDVLTGREGGAMLYSQLSNLYTDVQSSDFAPTQGKSC